MERSIVFCLYLARIKKSVTVQNTRKQFLTTPNILFIYGFWPILERLVMNSSGGLHELLVYPLTLPKILEMFCAFCTQTTIIYFEKYCLMQPFPTTEKSKKSTCPLLLRIKVPIIPVAGQVRLWQINSQIPFPWQGRSSDPSFRAGT